MYEHAAIYALSDFIAAARECFKVCDKDSIPRQLCQLLTHALKEQLFVNDCFKDAGWTGKKILYEDDRYGFCVCGHINVEVKESQPHNHGPSWAIYGQVAGRSSMVEWQQVFPATDHAKGKVKQLKCYNVEPGDVYLYDVGQIHSQTRTPGLLIRIEGQNLERIQKQVFEAV